MLHRTHCAPSTRTATNSLRMRQMSTGIPDDEAILVAKNHGTVTMVTLQIIVSLNNIHSFKGGSEYSGPYGDFIGFAQLFVLDIFELFHAGCTVKGDYANKLFISTLVVMLSVCGSASSPAL